MSNAPKGKQGHDTADHKENVPYCLWGAKKVTGGDRRQRSPQIQAMPSHAHAGEPRGQPHVYVTTAISLAEFMFMKKGQRVAGVVGKGRFSLVDFLPKI